jgi:hypothetical protein
VATLVVMVVGGLFLLAAVTGALKVGSDIDDTFDLDLTDHEKTCRSLKLNGPLATLKEDTNP